MVLKNTLKNIIASTLVASMFTIGSVRGQDAYSSLEKVKGDPDPIGIFLSNTMINGVVGGIGYAKRDKPFFEGFKKGALGGFVLTSGQYLTGRGIEFAWPGKLVNSLGASMVENTAEGKELFDRFRMDVGPVMLEYDRKEKSFSSYLLPFSTLGTLIYSLNGTTKFDLTKSLQIGTPVYYYKNTDNVVRELATFTNVITANQSALDDQALLMGQQRTNQYRNSAILMYILEDKALEYKPVKEKKYRTPDMYCDELDEMSKSKYFFVQDSVALPRQRTIHYKEVTELYYLNDTKHKTLSDWTLIFGAVGWKIGFHGMFLAKGRAAANMQVAYSRSLVN